MDRILHPSHHHPLDLKPVGKGKRKKGFNAECCVCRLRISDPVAYSCRDCRVFSHKSCAESPLPVHGHPFHPDHPLLLLHTPTEFDCPACNNHHGPLSKYGCEGCGFYLDLDCAMSASVAGEVAPPDVEAIQSYLANEHDHPLTRFFAARRRYLCSLCETGIKGEGYICLEPSCEFHAHEGCIRGLYYEDGTRIPRVDHEHQLFTHHDWRGTSKCKICNLKVPGEKIGCPTCSLVYHRKCLDVPDRLDYPPHPDHPLTLSIAESNNAGETLPCRSCGGRLLHQVVYGCSSCLYFLHISCANRDLGYLQGRTEAVIRAQWHKHPLLPCHGTSLRACHSCGRSVEGLGYVCSVDECGLLIHPSCLEQSLEVKAHPHHPEHPLVFVPESPGQPSTCDACRGLISGFRYYCADCNFSLDTLCASVLPDKKHELHEHQLALFMAIPSIQCNVCGDADDSAIFRCVPCDFNIHEGCMALPPSVKHKSHYHILHLRDHYTEDDSGVYYCEICAGRRNPELGAYVCRECNEDNLYAAHMECALSRELVVRVSRDPAIRRLEMRISELETEVAEMEMVETELKEARKERADILSNVQAQPFYNVDP